MAACGWLVRSRAAGRQHNGSGGPPVSMSGWLGWAPKDRARNGIAKASTTATRGSSRIACRHGPLMSLPLPPGSHRASQLGSSPQPCVACEEVAPKGLAGEDAAHSDRLGQNRAAAAAAPAAATRPTPQIPL